MLMDVFDIAVNVIGPKGPPKISRMKYEPTSISWNKSIEKRT